MLHLKSYVGSIVLAGLLLQGCGSSSDETAATAPQTSAEVIKTEKAMVALTATLNSLDGTEDDATIDAAFDKLKLELSASESSATTATAMQTAGVLSGLTDKVKENLVDAMDTSVGNKVTSAAFDVVLDSEGVTVVMLDAARKSHTMTRIMIDALEADWSLTAKMCPMLQTNQEFGEKFAALAEEEPQMARFFFSRVDAPMYNCLADAMLLSNNDSIHHTKVDHSTNAYMGIMMDMYATDYFIMPTATTNRDRRLNDNFVSLLLDTGLPVDYNSTTRTYTNHGDANELTNEKFFYSLFKTPGTTDSFVTAMKQVDPATRKMLMDSIFMGQPQDTTASADVYQGYLNVIAIASAMYDGIYGDVASNRTNGYGFGSYTSAFIGFAGLIPNDRYIDYAKAFMNAGYHYAGLHNMDVPTSIGEAWDYYTSETNSTESSNAPARSAGLGVVSSDWIDDVYDVMKEAASSINYSDLITSASDFSVASIITEINAQSNRVYGVFMYGVDENNVSVPTTISNPGYIPFAQDGIVDDTVSGMHGLIELAMQEDIFYVNCGSRAVNVSTSYETPTGYTCENNASYTMESAKLAFVLPAFSDITMEFAYNSAYDGASSYVSNIDNAWFADLSNNELIREYFYPDANNTYIPNSLLAIDWLKLPNNYDATKYQDYNYAIDFNSGYLDVFIVSENANLINEVNLPAAVDPLKTITMEKMTELSDSIIAVDANGQTIDGLYVYKIRLVSPADVEAVLAQLSGLSDTLLNAVGIDTTNAADVDNTDQSATN